MLFIAACGSECMNQSRRDIDAEGGWQCPECATVSMVYWA